MVDVKWGCLEASEKKGQESVVIYGFHRVSIEREDAPWGRLVVKGRS